MKTGKMVPSRLVHQPHVTGLFCKYSGWMCMQNRLEGYDFCSKHILEDKNSPYKQCSYVSGKTGRRCCNTVATPKLDKREGLCQDHAYKTMMQRNKMQSKPRPCESIQTLLKDLDHHQPRSSGDGEVKVKNLGNSNSNRIFDYVSSSDSDSEPVLVRDTWKGDGDSDAESIDSEQEDLLKHAGVYSAEEVASIFRDKLIRLQSLYIDQFKRLHHLLREKRRKFIRQRKFGTGGNIPFSAYNKLTALRRYQRRYGKEMLLHRQCKDRRMAYSEVANYKPTTYLCCEYTNGDQKCDDRTLPLSKYCLKHIMEDKRQVLYQYCNYGNACCRPVAGLQESVSCDLHIQLQPVECRYSKKEQESEAKDEPVDVVGMGDTKSDQPGQSNLKLTENIVPSEAEIIRMDVA